MGGLCKRNYGSDLERRVWKMTDKNEEIYGSCDYISRQAAIDAFEFQGDLYGTLIDSLAYDAEDYEIRMKQIIDDIGTIKELPSADVAEVVRCKDCKDYDIINQPYDEGFCRKLNYSVDKDSFCSYGERRTDG